MTQMISMLCGTLPLVISLSSCSLTGDNQPPPNVTPTNQGVCLALAKNLPVRYHRLSVDDESRRNIELGNAAYRAACNIK